MSPLQSTKDEFIKLMRPGDIGLILADNFFATMQNWLRVKEKCPQRASHGFLVTNPPEIFESNGLHPSQATIIKNIGDSTKCWLFRHPDMNQEKFHDMMIYKDGCQQMGGHYSVGGIVQFGLQYVGIRKKLSDADGEFCTELTGHMILEAELPYVTELKPYEVHPSYQLSWFLGDGTDPRFYGFSKGWKCALSYDGQGNYFKNIL
jgi:hypothetical protein